jgi:hypothetical protein
MGTHPSPHAQTNPSARSSGVAIRVTGCVDDPEIRARLEAILGAGVDHDGVAIAAKHFERGAYLVAWSDRFQIFPNAVSYHVSESGALLRLWSRSGGSVLFARGDWVLLQLGCGVLRDRDVAQARVLAVQSAPVRKRATP